MASVVLSILLAGNVGGAPQDTLLAEGVPQRLEQIQRGIDAVQNDVNGMAAHVLNALIPSDQSQARFTPPVAVYSNTIVSCLVLNVAPSRRAIEIKLVRSDGTVYNQNFVGLDPGETITLGLLTSGDSTWWCHFYVGDGFRQTR